MQHLRPLPLPPSPRTRGSRTAMGPGSRIGSGMTSRCEGGRSTPLLYLQRY